MKSSGFVAAAELVGGLGWQGASLEPASGDRLCSVWSVCPFHTPHRGCQRRSQWQPLRGPSWGDRALGVERVQKAVP